LKSAITVNGEIVIHLPTKDRYGKTVYANDLGMGYQNGYEIPCEIKDAGGGSCTEKEVKCKIKHG
jgi:hypothetical protein